MLKTKKQIAETVIKDYKSFIRKANKLSCKQFKKLLVSRSANLGICNYVSTNYNKYITYKKFVEKHCKYSSRGVENGLFSSYWWKAPEYARTKKETIECLQKRIDILKTWL